MLEETVGFAEETPKARQVGKHGSQSDHGEIAERIKETTTSRGHAFAAEAVDLHIRLALPQSVDEVGAMKIAARFPRADE